jgi:hypothetical protein
MKHLALKTLALASLAALAAAGTAHAQSIAGASSDTGHVLVGVSQVNGGPHSSGHPGLAVPATGLASQDIVDFQGLAAYSPADSHGVTTLNYPAPTPAPGGAPDDHANLGVFHFAKVSNADVWYGEWQATSSVADGTHTVYYAGDTTGTTLPGTGTATYTVQGISNYSGTPLTGAFSADFGSHTLIGALTGAQTVRVNATIASDASFAGTAALTAGSTSATGTSQGRFYGANAAALAGIASFGAANRQYDTAFGGTKN